MAYTGKFIITGPIGSGRTSLIQHLSGLGYWCAQDASEEVLKNIKSRKSYAFNQAGIDLGKELYSSAPSEQACFFDGGIPDIVANARQSNDSGTEEYEEVARMYRYKNPIFFLPYWRALAGDDVHSEAIATSRIMERHLFEVYRDLGYNIFTLPRDSIQERAGLVLSIIGGQKDND
ncbi:MAG: AAA family ATPase [Candidatus Paceibacterota bacterium]